MTKAVIRNGKIVYGTDATPNTSTELEASANRRDMKVKHRKDLLQKSQVDYYKAYKDQAKNLSPELRRLVE